MCIKERKKIFNFIGVDEFDSEIINTTNKRPVLLSYICFDSGYKKQVEILEQIFLKYFNGLLKVFILKEEFISQRQTDELRMSGSPEFILFYNGKEIVI